MEKYKLNQTLRVLFCMTHTFHIFHNAKPKCFQSYVAIKCSNKVQATKYIGMKIQDKIFWV